MNSNSVLECDNICSESCVAMGDDFHKSIKKQLGHVVPLKKNNHVNITPDHVSIKRGKPTILPVSKPIDIDYPVEVMIDVDTVSAEEKISYKRMGWRDSIYKSLAKAHYDSHNTIDLHGLTANEAMGEIKSYIALNQAPGEHYVLLIHGKGQHSQSNQPPILKNALNQNLRTHPAVVAFISARPQQGGAGALYVLFKTE